MSNVTVNVLSESTESTTIEVTLPAKRTLNQASQDRIAYEMNALAKKEARLAKLKVGTPAYNRCLESIKKTAALILKVEGKMETRVAKKMMVAQPANDTAVEMQKAG
jgi:hypothetical protein